MPATLAFPDDDPQGVRHGYEREGLDAILRALDAIPSVEAAQADEQRRRAALRVPLPVPVILSERYLNWVIGVRGTRPTTALA